MELHGWPHTLGCELPFALLLTILTVSGLLAQDRVTVSDTDPCRDCISLQPGSFIDGSDERLFIATHPRIDVDSQGSAAVADLMGAEVYLFDSAGRLVLTLGGAGDGPGELRAIGDLLFTPDDSLYVFEMTGRVSVFDAEGNFGRRFHTSGGQPRAVAPAASGAFFRAGQVLSRDGIGYPMHQFSAEGEHQCGFGAESPSFNPRGDPPQEILEPDIVAQGPHGRVHLVVRYRYEIEVWEPCGNHLTTMRRAAEWFPGLRSPEEYHDYVDPENGNPVVASIHIDGAGRLWTTVVVPPPSEQEDVEYLRGDFGSDQRFDTILEVIDLDSGELLATARIPVVAVFTSGGALLKRETDQLGAHSLRTWTPLWGR